MLSEERIKEQFHLARIDQENERNLENTKVYFRSDYIGKEFIKSFFGGTICFILIAALWVMKDLDALMVDINTWDYLEVGKQLIVLYVAFIVLYMIVTFLVYFFRFQRIKKMTKEYRGHAKKLAEIYEKESSSND